MDCSYIFLSVSHFNIRRVVHAGERLATEIHFYYEIKIEDRQRVVVVADVWTTFDIRHIYFLSKL